MVALDQWRGKVSSSRPAYPGVLHLEIEDAEGRLWKFASQYADYQISSPADDDLAPEALLGKELIGADLEAHSARLTLFFSDQHQLLVGPGEIEPGPLGNITAGKPDDPPYWELLAPEDRHFEFGPGWRWRVGFSSDPS